LSDLRKEYSSLDARVRFTLSGSENSLKKISKDKFALSGIEIKCKVKDVEVQEFSREHILLTTDIMLKKFESFCTDNNLDYESGIKFLKRRLK